MFPDKKSDRELNLQLGELSQKLFFFFLIIVAVASVCVTIYKAYNLKYYKEKLSSVEKIKVLQLTNKACHDINEILARAQRETDLIAAKCANGPIKDAEEILKMQLEEDAHYYSGAITYQQLNGNPDNKPISVLYT